MNKLKNGLVGIVLAGSVVGMTGCEGSGPNGTYDEQDRFALGVLGAYGGQHGSPGVSYVTQNMLNSDNARAGRSQVNVNVNTQNTNQNAAANYQGIRFFTSPGWIDLNGDGRMHISEFPEVTTFSVNDNPKIEVIMGQGPKDLIISAKVFDMQGNQILSCTPQRVNSDYLANSQWSVGSGLKPGTYLVQPYVNNSSQKSFTFNISK